MTYSCRVGSWAFTRERVSSTVAAKASVDVNGGEVDTGPLLSMSGMDLSPIIAGVATLAVAEVVFSADFAGGIPAVVGEVPLTDVAGMALPAVAEGIPSAVCFREPHLAVAEVDPLFVAETASPADLWRPAGLPDILNPLSNDDSGDQEDTVTVPELEFFPTELGLTDPTGVMRRI